jgi:peptidoglycan hydrolase-like protein with peptidoglycan-binding domain
VRSKSESYSDSIAAQVQRKLKKLGYYTDAVDGEIGTNTRAAIRAYQEDNGLEITGRIDKALLGSLEL